MQPSNPGAFQEARSLPRRGGHSVRCILGWSTACRLSRPRAARASDHRLTEGHGVAGPDGQCRECGPSSSLPEGSPEKEVTPSRVWGPALHCPLQFRGVSAALRTDGHQLLGTQPPTSCPRLPTAPASGMSKCRLSLDSWHPQTPNTSLPRQPCHPTHLAAINLRLDFVLLVESSSHWHFNPNKNITKIMLDKSYIIKM